MNEPLTTFEAERAIQRIACLPTGVGLRSHCRTRMKQRRLDALDIVRMLRNPKMAGPPYKRKGEWRYRVMERAGNAPTERRGVFGTTTCTSTRCTGGDEGVRHEVLPVRTGRASR